VKLSKTAKNLTTYYFSLKWPLYLTDIKRKSKDDGRYLVVYSGNNEQMKLWFLSSHFKVEKEFEIGVEKKSEGMEGPNV